MAIQITCIECDEITTLHKDSDDMDVCSYCDASLNDEWLCNECMKVLDVSEIEKHNCNV